MNFRHIISSLIAVTATGLSPIALAGSDLIIYNNTDFYSTTKTNKTLCSSKLLGENGTKPGISPPHAVNVVPGGIVKVACFKHDEDCSAEVFLNDNCGGPTIATVLFSIHTGIKAIVNESSSDYCVSGSGFTVSLDHKNSAPCQS